MNANPSTAEEVGKYHRDGFLIVRKLYTPDVAADWKQRIVSIMRADRTIDDPVGVRVWTESKLDPFLRERMADPHVVSILKALIGPSVEFLSVKAAFKSAATDFASPWHHDWAYWNGSHKISIWIALDPADRTNGCLKMIPGSHRRTMDCSFTEEGIGFGWRVNEEALKDLPVETLEVDPGDAVFFHDLTVHSSHPNTAKKDRWSFISTYRDASVPDESATWKTSMRVS